MCCCCVACAVVVDVVGGGVDALPVVHCRLALAVASGCWLPLVLSVGCRLLLVAIGRVCVGCCPWLVGLVGRCRYVLFAVGRSWHRWLSFVVLAVVGCWRLSFAVVGCCSWLLVVSVVSGVGRCWPARVQWWRLCMVGVGWLVLCACLVVVASVGGCRWLLVVAHGRQLLFGVFRLAHSRQALTVVARFSSMPPFIAGCRPLCCLWCPLLCAGPQCWSVLLVGVGISE